MEDQLLKLLDIAMAAILSGIVGIEREIAKKPAGFRTQMITGAAAALLVSLGDVFIIHFQKPELTASLQTDPFRIIEAIIVGISFIGAGTIIKQEAKHTVKYLTTAATILFSGGIGISVALKQYVLAVGLVIMILLINQAARYIDRLLRSRNPLSDEDENG